MWSNRPDTLDRYNQVTAGALSGSEFEKLPYENNQTVYSLVQIRWVNDKENRTTSNGDSTPEHCDNELV